MTAKNDTLHRPVVNGVPLITVEELAEATGLSVLYLRERTRTTRRAAARIPAYKIGIRLWFNKDEAIAAIYINTRMTHIQQTPPPSTRSQLARW